MDDLISRQAAIDAVNTALFPKILIASFAEKALRKLPSAQSEEDCLKCIFRGSPGFKQFQTAQHEMEWIPVSKRVPNENKYYLTTTVNGEVYCDRWIEDNFDRTELVIAWMPLPEPYKEVDDDYSK